MKVTVTLKNVSLSCAAFDIRRALDGEWSSAFGQVDGRVSVPWSDHQDSARKIVMSVGTIAIVETVLSDR